MTQLNKFTFYICSLSRFYNDINLPSNEHIQNRFTHFNDKQIIYSTDYFSKVKKGYCHIYSYRYQLKYNNKITNNYPGGIFKYVGQVELYDQRPFQHQFFLRIQK
ncbi:unnamed protein product [Rotaria sordida]|uniref:Uncharacterized protein n=1 Tax=Rotaria sordida TaxID=392033 RepID=A0A815L138_9BILA|nr:unnamed protein product [Rotaria sordida]CAF4329586.1 unnamed protein product [Rotaria sordida]